MKAMKSDLGKFIELYTELGADIKVNKKFDPSGTICTENTIILVADGWAMAEGEVTTCEKFGGYNGFYSTIDFDGDGNFISQGFWE